MTETSSAPAQPLFYRAPTLLTFQQHARVGLRPGADAGFAAEAAALPLVLSEFALAQRHYPIVFTSDAQAMPLAVTALAAGRNLFVGADGAWAPGCYVPGYVRRYPFIAMAPQAGGQTMLGFDAASARISTDGSGEGVAPLFGTDGTPTEVARNAMAFCDAYAREHEATRAFAAALLAHGLLVERAATLRRPDGSEQVVNGFRLIDEAAFRALGQDALAELHATGWLDLIVLHLASQANWIALAERAAQHTAQAEKDGAPLN